MKIFRKIRQDYLKRAKFGPYLKYAIGEIILVVAGILIALQINNWNQERTNAEIEQLYLLGLKDEFQISKLKLEKLILINQKNYTAAKDILELTNSHQDSIVESLFSRLLYQALADDISFNPNNSLVLEMINSGNLKILSNTDLRKQLTNWMSTLQDIARQEGELTSQRVKVLDMFRSEDYSLKSVFESAGVSEAIGLPKHPNNINNASLLNSKKFENNLLLFIITSLATEQAHYKPLINDLDSIMNLIHTEID